jgi:hypothetical protein
MPTERCGSSEFRHRGENEAGDRRQAEAEQHFVGMPDHWSTRHAWQRQPEPEKAQPECNTSHRQQHGGEKQRTEAAQQQRPVGESRR